MGIDYEAHEVFNPDYLAVQLEFVSGVLELLEENKQIGQWEVSHISCVLTEANNRVRDILEQLGKAVMQNVKEG